MIKLKRRKTFAVIFSILISILTAVSLPLIPLGIIYEWVAVWIISVVCLVHGMFGLTFYWLVVAWLSRCLKLVKTIEKQYVYNANDLAKLLGQDREQVVKDIRMCIENEWLTGMFFDGVVLYANKNAQLKCNPSNVTCEYCGSYFLKQSEDYCCPNCGAPISAKSVKGE